MEAPGGGSQKRSLDQVVKKPRFVAQERDGGSYGFEDMPKRFKCNYRADEARVRLMSPHMDTIDAESIALSYRLNAYLRAAFCDKDDNAAAAPGPVDGNSTCNRI